MKAPPKPFKLPGNLPGEYYESPLLAWLMVKLYNEGKVSWEEAEPSLRKGVLYEHSIHKQGTQK